MRIRLFLMAVLRWLDGIWEVLTSMFWFLSVVGLLVTITLAVTSTNQGLTSWSAPEFTVYTHPSRLRFVFAYVVASTWYIWASLAYVNWIVLWVCGIAKKNVVLRGLPQAENFWEIGQWSSFVGVTLAVLAACASGIRIDGQAKKRVVLLDSSCPPHLAPLAWLRRRLSKLGEEQNPWQVEITLAEEWEEAKLWFKDPVKASGVLDPPHSFRYDDEFELANALGERRSEEGRVSVWSLMQDHAYTNYRWSDVGQYGDEGNAVERDGCPQRPLEVMVLTSEHVPQ